MKTRHRASLARFAAIFLLFAASVGIASAQAKHPDIKPDAGMDLYGSILDNTGAPVAGVVVSDGFQCVITDAKGVYQMKRHRKARMVYYSTPEDFTVHTANTGNGGAALFHAKLTKRNKRYNFDLVRLSAPEKNFTLICVGDPQVRNEFEIKRYKEETVTDIFRYGKASALPCYAILLGDIGFDTMHMLAPMRETTNLAQIPYFAVIGNHDHDKDIHDDHASGAAFESIFGPLNYSFNRGGVHIIGMDNVLYEGAKEYTGGFTDEQVEWLRQNLSFVPKDKIIVLAYHIPLRHSGAKNREAVHKLLGEFAEVHLMAGHTHNHENFIVTKPAKAYEHIHATACGAWWRSTMNTDGAPNGFALFTFNANKVADWFYKATFYGRGYQMRMYRGDERFGGASGKYGYKNTNENDIVVDVWNADPEWKLVAYENGVEAGALKKLPQMVDAYAAGLHGGVQGGKSDSLGLAGNGTNKHLYKHTLKDKNAKVEIRATDRFGNTYTLSKFTTDLAGAERYGK